MNNKNNFKERFEAGILAILKKSKVNTLIVGVSGGADSIALLFALANLANRGFISNLMAIHCNFHLRGEESQRDQRFVEMVCKQIGVKLHIKEFDIDAYRTNKNISIEMACRELRYEEFRSIKRSFNYDRIAIAHNSDDNIETLFLNLFRGSGVKGLRGMVEDTGEIIRPLLSIPRIQIEQYLEIIGFDYITDSTNLEDLYRRNFIRNKLLPLIEDRWPGVKKAISKTIVNLQSEEKILDHYANEQLEGIINLLPFTKITNSPDPFWIIKKFTSKFGINRYISTEILDVYNKKKGTNEIIGKSWKAKEGIIKFTKKGLVFLPNE